MERYITFLKQTDSGVTATCPALNVTCDAPDIQSALYGVRKMCEDTGKEILLGGGTLPAEDSLVTIGIPDGTIPTILEFHLNEQYRAAYTAPVRRTVSLPDWLDKQLRNANVDASRLFQDAASDYLKRMETEARGIPKITSVKDLEDACAPGILDSYFTERLRRLCDDAIHHINTGEE